MVANRNQPHPSDKYEQDLLGEINTLYDLASKAKEKSEDPIPMVESKIVFSHGETLEYLLGLEGLANRFEELCKQLPRSQVPFKIAEDVIYGRFGSFEDEARALLAIRAGLGCITPPGSTAAPLEGITSARLKQNPDRSNYLAIYFAGPMRSAGGTEQALSILIGDFVRSALHLSNYIPSPEEIARFIEEYKICERKVSRFQYRTSEEQLLFVLQRMPIEVTGVGTDPFEVLTHKNLPRIETNFIRGGALRVLIDGFIGRAEKVLKFVRELNLSGWDWLSEVKATRTESSHMNEVLIGRPVLSSVNSFGGFRIRYGRARNTGLAAIGVHPNTMGVVDSFVAVGSQLRIDRPGKSSVVVPVDSIEPPVVKLKDGSVVKLEGAVDWAEIDPQIKEVLFLGDILISVGDYIENNKRLDVSAFTGEWWAASLAQKASELPDGIKSAAQLLETDEERLALFLSAPPKSYPDFKEALKIATRFGIPLHPRYVNFWERCTGDEVLELCKFLKQKAQFMDNGIVFHSDSSIDEILNKAVMLHRADGGTTTVIDSSVPLIHLLCTTASLVLPQSKESGLSYIARALNIPLKETIGSTISARFGRPEAAKPRLMKPPVNLLFPVGNAGGPSRDLRKAEGKGSIKVEIINRRCPSCNIRTFHTKCPECSKDTIEQRTCPKCGSPCENFTCKKCGSEGRPFGQMTVNLQQEIRRAQEAIGLHSLPNRIKGVKSLMNDERIAEPLEKGILRAAFNLFVYRDGTCRFDASNAPLTAFKPKETGTGLHRLLELGYDRDVEGKPLSSEDQLVFLKPQDVLMPRKAISFLVGLSKFLDRSLQTHGLEPCYRASNEGDLIGKHIISISPHTVGGIVGRIIGFTGAEVLYAHPYYHQAKRRDCDGDADSFTLALDVFMNFSKRYTPSRPGGKMDSPLVVFPIINPREIDDQIYNMENSASLPLAFYTISEQRSSPSELRDIVNLVGPEAPAVLACTHATQDVTAGPLISKYRTIKTASEKFLAQLNLLDRLSSLNKKKILQNILDTHLIRDFSGNVKALYSSGFRCTKCGERYRRPPLSGHCRRCGYVVQPNVFVSNVVKYFNMIELLTSKYELDPYYLEALKSLGQELKHLPSRTEKKEDLPGTKVESKRRSESLSKFLGESA